MPPSFQEGESPFFLGFLHSIGTSDSEELSDSQLRRLLCHALLQRLPDEGLAEAMQSLADMNEFYRLPRFVPPQPLPQKSIPVRIGETILAPVYPVTED